jgi:hypothetical protein
MKLQHIENKLAHYFKNMNGSQQSTHNISIGNSNTLTLSHLPTQKSNKMNITRNRSPMDVAQKKYTKGKSTEIADEKNFNFGTV